MYIVAGGEKYPSAFTYYRRFRAHSLPSHSNWIEEIRSCANFLMRYWDLPNVGLVFVVAPFRAARRICRKYFRARRARAPAALALTR
jgi:hypothetical protein